MFDHSGLMVIQLDKKLMFRHNFLTKITWQIWSVKLDQAGIYKYFATNEYGNAVCNVTLTVKGKWNIKP